MRGGIVFLLLLVPALAGCTSEDGGGFFDFLTADEVLDGPCGHAYNENWEKQIILEVQFTQDTLGRVDARDLEVTATYFGKTNEASSRDARPYSTKHVDSKGCLAFPLDEEGGYSFWAFAETDTAYCYVDGRLDGTYSGGEVVEGILLIDRHFGADHC